MLGFIIICIFLGVFLAIIIAPFMMMGNKNRLEEMDQLMDEFEAKEFSNDKEKEKEKKRVKREMLKLKSQIISDKAAQQQAQDKVSIL